LRAFCRRDVAFSLTAARGRERTQHERDRDATYQRLRRLRRERDGATDPALRENLSKMIDDLDATRGASLKRRGPATTRPLVTDDADASD
jgi:hypothetical protein